MDMSGAEVWRVNFDPASLTAVSVDGLNESAMSKDEFDNLRAQIEEVPEGEERKNALERIGKLNPDNSGNVASARETSRKKEHGQNCRLDVFSGSTQNSRLCRR